jgi:hypothetical protein
MAEGKVVSLLPAQDATADVTRRRPGRPRSIEKRPTFDDLAYHAEIAEQRLEFLEADPVVQSVKKKTEAPRTIHEIRINLAKEAADLEWQKLELGKRGRDVSQVISRRADILLRLASLELEAARADASTLDPWSEPMQRIFKLWVQSLQKVVGEVLSEAQADAFYVKLGARLENWEKEVEEALR